jgi:hypothetical protein
VISPNEPGENSQKSEKQDGPNQDGVAFKELNVFVVTTLDVHGDYLAEILGF